MDRITLKQEAKSTLASSNAHPYLTTLIYLLVVGILTGVSGKCDSLIISTILSILTTVISFGYTWWGLSVARQNGSVGEFAFAFSKIIPIIILSIVMAIVVCLGYVLLIVPGVMLSFGWSMASYVLRDNIESGLGALSESWRITKGHKMDLFVLGLSFIPWMLLGIITCGLAFIYVYPYMSVTYAKAYESLKANAQ